MKLNGIGVLKRRFESFDSNLGVIFDQDSASGSFLIIPMHSSALAKEWCVKGAHNQLKGAHGAVDRLLAKHRKLKL